MNRRRRVLGAAVMSAWLPVSMCIALAQSPAYAQDLGTAAARSPQDVFEAVPGDAWAVVCIPKVSRFDQHLMAFGQQMQAPMVMGIGTAKMMAGIMTGFDDDGALAAALLPMANMGEIGQSVVVFLPTTDFAGLLSNLSPEPADHGMTKIMLWGQTTYAAPFGRFTAVAETPETITKVLNSSTTFRKRLEKDRIERISADDVTVWVNMSAFTRSEMYNGFAAMLAMMGQDPDLYRQFDSACLSLTVDPAGLKFGLHVDADPASDMGKAMAAVTATSDSLLKGLPAEPFILAMGQMTNKTAGKFGADIVDKMLEQAAQQAGEQKDLVDGLRKVVVEVVGDVRHVSFSIAPLAPGADGMVGVAAVVTTEGDSQRLCDAIETVIGDVKKALADDPEAAQHLDLIQYTRNAEKVGDAAVDHLSLSLPQDPEVEEWANHLKKIVGKDGVTFRLVRIKQQLVVTLGGGITRLEQIVAAAKSNSTALADEQGVKRVSGHLPAKRSSEAYVCVDRLLKLVVSVAEAIGKPNPIPVAIPEINAPIVLGSTPSGKAGSQTELFVPMELLRAIKDAAAPMMMGQPQQQMQPDPNAPQ